jgi:hypothetical protein
MDTKIRQNMLRKSANYSWVNGGELSKKETKLYTVLPIQFILEK